jgi:ABC-type amino acid transport substrate-binding protein
LTGSGRLTAVRDGWIRRVGLGLAVALACAACASASTTISLAPGSPSPSAATAAGGELEKLRARGTLIVAIRVEAPPPNRSAGDPAHAQKRAFEAAVAALVAQRIIGPNAKVELRSVGGDRLAALDQGADIAMTVDTAAGRDRAQLSVPYAANAIVLAAKSGGPVKALEDIRGGTIAVAMDELGAREVAQAYLQERGIAATLDTYMGVSGAATALEAGKASALIGDKVGVAVIAADRSLSIVAVIAQRPYVIAVRKTAPDVAKAISEALRAALDSGAIRDAAAKASFPYEAP